MTLKGIHHVAAIGHPLPESATIRVHPPASGRIAP